MAPRIPTVLTTGKDTTDHRLIELLFIKPVAVKTMVVLCTASWHSKIVQLSLHWLPGFTMQWDHNGWILHVFLMFAVNILFFISYYWLRVYSTLLYEVESWLPQLSSAQIYFFGLSLTIMVVFIHVLYSMFCWFCPWKLFKDKWELVFWIHQVYSILSWIF